MTNQLPLVLVSTASPNEGSLQLDDGDTVEIGTTRWFDWLEDHNSFRFESGLAGENSFTARKHERDSGAFWYAYRKLGKKLCNAYLGKSERLSVERMLEVAGKLCHKSKPKLGNGYAQASYASECITGSHDDSEPTDKEMSTGRMFVGGVIRWNVYESVEGYDREQKKNAWGEWKLIGSYKTEYQADKSIASREEHNHRLNSARDYGIVGLRFDKRCEVIAPATADITVTPTVKELQVMVDQLRSHLVEAEAHNAALDAEVKKWVQSSAQLQYQLDEVITERDNAQSQLDDMASKAAEWYEKASASNQQLQNQENSRALLPDLDVVRDRILQNLKLGKQAPEYKRTKAILERFIQEIQQQ